MCYLQNTNLWLHLSVAGHKLPDFLSHPTHSQETHCARSPKIIGEHISSGTAASIKQHKMTREITEKMEQLSTGAEQ